MASLKLHGAKRPAFSTSGGDNGRAVSERKEHAGPETGNP